MRSRIAENGFAAQACVAWPALGLIRQVTELSDVDPPILEYAVPPKPVGRNGLRARLISGGIAGAVTFASVYLVGPLGMGLVGIVSGLIVGFVSAHYATSRVMLAGVFGNLTCVASFSVCSSPLWIASGASSPLHIDWWESAVTTGLLSAIFIVPGLFGSLWVWEGRKPFPPEAKEPRP